MPSPILIITGPTASGKSSLALYLAQKLGGVIINADSQQLYAPLRILTARPSEEDMQHAPHKLYGMLNADQPCSAGMWLNLAKMEIDWVRAQGMLPIIVGGTGLYIKSLLEGIADIPDVSEAVKAQAEADYNHMGKDAYADRLKWVDPEFFERLKVYDRQRLIRAYAVWLGSGKPLSYWQSITPNAPYPEGTCHLYNVEINRELLYSRCNSRVESMAKQGALDEVKSLYNAYPEATYPNRDLFPVMKSVGVREFGAYINQQTTLEDAISATQQATRHYAKRQLTWMRGQFKDASKVPYHVDHAVFAAKLAKTLGFS